MKLLKNCKLKIILLLRFFGSLENQAFLVAKISLAFEVCNIYTIFTMVLQTYQNLRLSYQHNPLFLCVYMKKTFILIFCAKVNIHIMYLLMLSYVPTYLLRYLCMSNLLSSHILKGLKFIQTTFHFRD